MGWTDLPRGSFTGIDWANPERTAGADPYLVWAEASGFSGCAGSPQWLPIILELSPGHTLRELVHKASGDWLRVPAAYLQAPKEFRFCTARVKRGFFDATGPGGPLNGWVSRLEMGLPLVSDLDDLPTNDPAAKTPAVPAQAIGGDGPVLGLIDDGFALAHANFQHAGQPRIAYFWRQDAVGAGRVPGDLGYGHELEGRDIAQAMDRHTYNGLVDESAVYTSFGLSRMGQVWPKGRVPFHALDTCVSHGTHVMDLAAGPRTLQARLANVPPQYDAPPSWAPAGDEAARCPLIAVQLDYQTVKDTSGGSMAVHVLDALMYILGRCSGKQPVVVNISFGTLAGPHDGTSTLEAAMAQLQQLWQGRLQIVLAAGNSYQLCTHANVTLAPGPTQSTALHWRVQPDDATQSFLELWLQDGAQGVQVEITPPGAAPLPPLNWGSSGMWVDASGQPLCALIYPRQVATGRHGTCALLTLAPTFSDEQAVCTAPSGVWTIGLHNADRRPVTIDAYVERDDVVVGTRSGARQSHLEDDPRLDPAQQYDPQAYVDQPRRATPVRRSGNFNSIATGAVSMAVGGRRLSDDSWSHYSPRRPDPDESRAERPGVVKMPAASGFSDENAALAGVPAAGTRSGAAVRMAGTSAASPQAARALLNELTSGPAASSSA